MGVKIVTSEGMLLEKLGFYFEKKADDGCKLCEMAICPWCLPTPCSIAAHFFAFGLGLLPFEWNYELLIRWPLVIAGSSFICGNVWNIYETINRVREKNEAEANYFNGLLEIEKDSLSN